LLKSTAYEAKIHSVSAANPHETAMTTAKSTLQKIPAGVWVLGFVSMLMDVSSEMIHSLLPLFLVTTLGASVFAVGLIEGLAESTALIVKVFSGAFSDYLGKRKGLATLGYAMSALTKPLFAVASSTGIVLAARLLDRVGKGVRGAPRDALLADITPPHLYGASFGLRQSLDTVGAFLGPLLAVGLMLRSANNFRAVFWVAVIPGLMAVALLFFGLREPEHRQQKQRANPIQRQNLKRLGGRYWRVAGIGAVFTLARFSEAFLVLRAQQCGVPIALVPLVMVAMNLVYALSAYPFGKLSDHMSHRTLLALGLIVLIASDAVLASNGQWGVVLAGVSLWGVHMGITQGLMAAMVADTAPADLRGTAYGFFNLISGLAMLLASLLAGLLWDRLGAPFTFYAGATFCAIALAGLAWQPALRRIQSVGSGPSR
jgi:MFS family permease